MKSKLYYVYDPMCSWCYAFKKNYDELRTLLPNNIEVINIVGGLARETDELMPKEMCAKIENIWYEIENTTGTKFNHDFWKNCKPRRDTYKACKAVLCAKEQGFEYEMISAIQKAYYQEARNPSDLSTLIQLAKELNLDLNRFEDDLKSRKAQELLNNDLEKRRKLKVFSFPTLLLQYKKELYPIQIDFKDTKKMLNQIIDLSSNAYF